MMLLESKDAAGSTRGEIGQQTGIKETEFSSSIVALNKRHVADRSFRNALYSMGRSASTETDRGGVDDNHVPIDGSRSKRTNQAPSRNLTMDMGMFEAAAEAQTSIESDSVNYLDVNGFGNGLKPVAEMQTNTELEFEPVVTNNGSTSVKVGGVDTEFVDL